MTAGKSCVREVGWDYQSHETPEVVCISYLKVQQYVCTLGAREGCSGLSRARESLPLPAPT